MDTLFLKILNMSISASWLILAIILLRVVLKKVPKWINVLLWALVAVRLLCPISLESSLSLVPNAEPIPQEIFMVEPPANHESPVFDPVENPNLPNVPSVSIDASIEQIQWKSVFATFGWAFGIVAMLAYAMLSYAMVKRKVKASLHLRDNIWICDDIQTPFILGAIKPKIYITSGTDETQLPHIIAHENAHLKRRDHWWKPLGFVVLAVHWFNPLVWVAYILLCRDIELACDEKVIRELNQSESIAYSEALLSCSVNRRMVMVCPLAFGEVGVKERVKRVLNYKKPAFWLIVLAIIACVVVAICFLTNPKNYSEEIQVNGQIYLRQENEVETLPVGSYELGELSSILHRTKEHPSEDFAATNLDEKYAGNMLYQSGVDTNTIYLEDLSGFYIPFSTQSISDETMLAAQGIWTRKDTSNPIEMLSYLCVLDLWGGNVQEEMQISVPGNFGPHAHFSDAPSNADTLDVAMAKRAFLLMRLYPEEVFYVTWSYPDEGGEQVHREFHADEMSAILSLSSHSQIYEIPASDEDVNRLIQFLMIDEKLFLRHATEGNDFSPLLEAQKNAVWFTPEDIHDIEYMELVWHDGKRFTPLTGEGYEYITERFSEATEIRGGTGCPFHSVLYIHRSDGVVGKVLPAEDSCDMFQSNGKYYQFGDRSEPPYSDSNETFYNHFGTSLEELPHYQVASTGEPLTSEELAQFNETFIPIVYDKQGNPIGVNPLSCFFTSYYDDVRNLDFEEFMRYFPEDGSFASDAEFEALKTVEAWPFDWVETRDDMPVPIHKYQARIVDMVLKENAGITTDDLDTSDVVYLPEYDAFYNYTSDFGPGVFTCTRGEIDGDIVRLYEESDHGVDVLILKKVKNGYLIISHQQLK